MDIIDFIKEKDYKIELGSWFKDIWVPLFDKKDIVVTNEILNFIYDFQGGKHFPPCNLDKNYQNKRDYRSFLNKNEIEYSIIKYNENILNEYQILKNELKLYNKNNIVQKTWLVLSVDDFKESIMMLNNNNSKIIRKYYIKIEKILDEYNNYLKNHELMLKYNLKPNLMNIFDFMKENNLILTNNQYFIDMWLPLKDKKDILITNNLLEFMGFGDINNAVANSDHVKLRNIRKHFIEFIKDNNISYEEINYNNEKINNYEYIQNEIKNGDNRTIHSKRWIIMSIDNFKESIMMLNNSKSKEVRKYYIKLEKIFYSYIEYTNNYYREIEKIKLLEQENKIKKLEESSMRMKVFIDKIVEKEKNGYIYIATSKSYASINNFKLGKTSSLNSREINFNTSRNSQDEFYICYYKKVYNVDKVESLLKDVLDGFKDKKNKEIFIIHYKYLLELVEKTINNINEPYDYINDLIKNSLTDMYDLEPIVPNKIIKNEDKKMKYKDPVVYYMNSKTNKCKGERILSSDLYKNYTAWCELYGIDNILSIISFSKDLIKKGYVKKKFTNGANFLDLRYKNKAL
ncbi:N1R/p28-like protein [Choristoneura biennis entomopoxvirus]|uniref:N1R/p28-like protein n=1 Tax=Choristoneura biennis entomopoxvirus TaxID=10288 RepID=A0A916KPA9_CBEPV|nr:N1R/p28-like protein [Choristoneura biennis entomopoxvirus]YP_008004395.1 N1R/p28-like protein [Choristoneura biennis entomopoxvirus]CCU55578.1 N1R/p28-like protein [Choristoneura biennis entomopoxvirus]CCU55893.1 N1R/p28-like protein [Choristoneura biennis entomopoxvirus]